MPTTPSTPTPSTPTSCSLAPSAWRRLTAAEYRTTTREAFPGFTLDAAYIELPIDVLTGEFDNQSAAQGVNVGVLDGYYKAAQRIAAATTAEPDKLLGCKVAERGEDPCFEAFLDGGVTRLQRRPLPPEDRKRLVAEYRTLKTEGGFRFAVETVLQQVLTSPLFLYKVEGIAAGQPGRVDGHAVATRLAYFLWGGPPDSTLLAAAAAGRLNDVEEIARQAERLLAEKASDGTPRSDGGLGRFFTQLYDLDIVPKQVKSKTLYPTFGSTVAGLMAQETKAFLRHLATAPEVPIEDLFVAGYTFLNKDLATYYGASAPEATGSKFVKVALNPTRTAGLSTQGSFGVLSSREKTTSPISRGKFVRTRLMCEHLPEPPPDGVPPEPMFTGTETMREILAKHRTNPSCGACHRLIDPVGFAFENLDPAGRWRDRDLGGQAVDASGELVGTDVDGAFNGPVELARRLARSDTVRACLSQKLFTFAMGRPPTEGELCLLRRLDTERIRGGGGMKALVQAFVRADLFSARVVTP